MTDLYLRAPTEADMNAVLLGQDIIDGEGNPTSGFSVDQIGPIVLDDVEYPDWHTNLRGSFTNEQIAALEPMCVYPPVPYRVWA